jgi:hypothetical protein
VTQVCVPSDTDPEAFDVLVSCWRSLSVAERVALVDQMHADVEMMALTGIRAMNPGLDEHQVLHELARRRFGAALANEAYRQLLER